jgi:hypothetical protein
MSVVTRSLGPGRHKPVLGACGKNVLFFTPRPMTLRAHLWAESTNFVIFRDGAPMPVSA